MKIKTLLLISALGLLSACSPGAPTTEAADAVAAIEEPRPVSPTPTTSLPKETVASTPPPSPTPSAPVEVVLPPTPAALNPDNIDQLAQLYDYGEAISAQVGGSYLDVYIHRVQVSADGKRLAFTICTVASSGFICSSSGKGVVVILDDQGELVQRIEFAQGMRVAEALLSPDGSMVYVLETDVSNRTLIRAWDVATGELMTTVHSTTGPMNIRPDLCLSPDGATLAMLLGPQGLLVLSLADGTQLYQAQGAFSRCAFNQDGQRLLVLEFDYDRWETGMLVADLSSGKTLFRKPLEERAYGMAIAPDGRLAAISHAEGIDLWDLDQGSVFDRIETLPQVFSSLAFNPEGSLLLSAVREKGVSDFHVASAWETQEWTRVADIMGITLAIRDIRFTANGEKLLFVDEYGVPSLQGLPDPLLREAQSVLLSYMSALAGGDYARAADLYMHNPAAMDDPAEWIRTIGGDPDDMALTFELFCVPDALPCLPVKDVLFTGYDYDGQILFIVTLQTLDGETYVDEYGGSDVWLSATEDVDGRIKMISLHPGSFVQ